MSRSDRGLLGAFLVVAGVGCAAAAVVPHPMPEMGRPERPGEPEVPLADLSRGRAAYVAKCSGCHSLVSVPSRSDAGWRDALETMARDNNVVLSRDENDAILTYLTRANGRP